MVEHSSENAPELEAVVEGKVRLQTMDPLPSSGPTKGTLPSPSNQLALVMVQPGTGAHGSSMMTSVELYEELQRILASLHQGFGEADDSVAVAMDLSFLESMVTGIK